jgi:hypothetical protein
VVYRQERARPTDTSTAVHDDRFAGWALFLDLLDELQ